MGDKWHIVAVDVPSEAAELIADLMHELGSNGSMEERSTRPGSIRVLSYFDAESHEKERLLSQIKKSLGERPQIINSEIDLSTSIVTDWSREWRQWFRPFEIVSHIIVSPSWEKYIASKSDKLITLDPGMAFGTGLHATTKLCAKEIERLFRQFKSPSLLDVGTGSGLLAIVARKLGVEDILTVENDSEAIRVARENFEKNEIADVTILENIKDVAGPYHIVTANILLSTLLEIKDDLIRCTAAGGFLVLSGITHDQEDEIEAAYGKIVELTDKNRLDEWSCMTFKREAC